MHQDENLETLDVVDENDKVIGSIARGNMMDLKTTTGRYLRVVEVFIQRPNGDIYLPRRSKNKKIAPGGLDISAAGHIMSGEPYSKACSREIKEETGIETSHEQLEFITKIPPSSHLFYFREVYLLRTDLVPRLSPEHREAIWVAPTKLMDFVKNDAPTKETLIEDIPYLIDYLQKKTN